MHVSPLKPNQYAWFIRPFFWLQKKNYGQVLLPGMLWGRSPKLFATVASLYGVINRKSSPVDPVIRSLVTVRVSQLNWCQFCVDINSMTLANRAGSMDKVSALADWQSSELFTDKEKACIAYAEAMTNSNLKVTPELMADLKKHFDDNGIVELTGLIAFQNMSAKFNSALDVPAQGFCQMPNPEKSE